MPKHTKWDMSNPLYRWRMKHKGKANKLPSRKSSDRDAKMAKRKSRRRFSRFKRRFRRHDKRMPLSAGIGLGVSVFAPPAPGWGSAFEKIQAGAIPEAFQSFVRSWTGLAIGGIGGQQETSFNLWDTLNPLNMNEAPAWKSLFWSHIVMAATKKITHADPVSKLPVINKYLKFS